MTRVAVLSLIAVSVPTIGFAESNAVGFATIIGRIIDAMQGLILPTAGVLVVAAIAWLVVRDFVRWAKERREANTRAVEAKRRAEEALNRQREAFITVRGAKLLYRMAIRLGGFGTLTERVKRAYEEGFRPFWKGSFMPHGSEPIIRDLVARYREAIHDEGAAEEYARSLMEFFVVTVLRYGTWVSNQVWDQDDEAALKDLVAFAPTSDYIQEAP